MESQRTPVIVDTNILFSALVLWTGDKKLQRELRRNGFDRFFEPMSR